MFPLQETGAPALYVPSVHMAAVRHLPTGEESNSRALIDELLAHVTQQQFSYPHQWAPGDCVVWDNRCTQVEENAHPLVPYCSL